VLITDRRRAGAIGPHAVYEVTPQAPLPPPPRRWDPPPPARSPTTPAGHWRHQLAGPVVASIYGPQVTPFSAQFYAVHRAPFPRHPVATHPGQALRSVGEVCPSLPHDPIPAHVCGCLFQRCVSGVCVWGGGGGWLAAEGVGACPRHGDGGAGPRGPGLRVPRVREGRREPVHEPPPGGPELFLRGPFFWEVTLKSSPGGAGGDASAPGAKASCPLPGNSVQGQRGD